MMLLKPRIALPVPTSFDNEYNDRCWPQYALAIEQSGGVPVAIDLGCTPGQVAKLVTTCQAVLLPGSPADVNPEKYGESRGDTTAPPDMYRENVDELLLQDAHNLYKPILGICFGLQILNTWRGGTLTQELRGGRCNHAAGPDLLQAHTIVLPQGTLLREALFPREEASNVSRVAINSSHHQAIKRPGDNLRISARSSDDAVIEAVESSRSSSEAAPHFVVAVQWHPERTFASDASSRNLFLRFVSEAGQWAPRAVTASVR